MIHIHIEFVYVSDESTYLTGVGWERADASTTGPSSNRPP